MTVVLKVMGGLASQLLKYSLGRTLADANNSDLLLDLDWYGNCPQGDTPREFYLSMYNSRYSLASPDVIQKLKTPSLLVKTQRFLAMHGLNSKLLWPSHHISGLSQGSLLNLRPPVYIEGEWFSFLHFNSHKEVLLRDLSLLSPLRSSAYHTLCRILKTNSIAVHIRRGDYLSNPAASSYHTLLPLSYYASAIRLCLSIFNDPVFYFFSDDIEWSKASFESFGIRSVFVADNSPCEDLFLMSSCKHQVIANSGFSWFGSWLNTYSHKRIFAPNTWVSDMASNQAIVAELIQSGAHIIR